MFNYAGTSRAGAGAATATPPSSGSIRQTNQQPSKPSMRRDLSNRSSKSIVGGGGSLWRVQWKMNARVLEPVRHRTRHRHCGRCTPSYSRMASDELISYLSWPRSPGHDSRSAISSAFPVLPRAKPRKNTRGDGGRGPGVRSRTPANIFLNFYATRPGNRPRTAPYLSHRSSFPSPSGSRSRFP